jgi:RNA polymerase sigma factor for flagellar operon FliA
LPAEARTLIQATYFEGLTLQDAAKRIGISKAWASRLHVKTLQQLANALRHAGVAD